MQDHINRAIEKFNSHPPFKPSICHKYDIPVNLVYSFFQMVSHHRVGFLEQKVMQKMDITNSPLDRTQHVLWFATEFNTLVVEIAEYRTQYCYFQYFECVIFSMVSRFVCNVHVSSMENASGL